MKQIISLSIVSIAFDTAEMRPMNRGLNDILLAISDELKLIVPKFALPLYRLFLIILLFGLFWVLSVQNNTGLDRKIYNHGQTF